MFRHSGIISISLAGRTQESEYEEEGKGDFCKCHVHLLIEGDAPTLGQESVFIMERSGGKYFLPSLDVLVPC